MDDVTNEDRAGWAATALKAFAKETGQDKSGDLEHEPAQIVGDLLCNLQHYCRANGIDFKTCLKNGTGNFKEEVAEEE